MECLGIRRIWERRGLRAALHAARYGLRSRSQYVAGAFLGIAALTTDGTLSEARVGRRLELLRTSSPVDSHSMYGKTGANSSLGSRPVISSGDAGGRRHAANQRGELLLWSPAPAVAVTDDQLALEVRVWAEVRPNPEAAVSRVAGGLTVPGDGVVRGSAAQLAGKMSVATGPDRRLDPHHAAYRNFKSSGWRYRVARRR